MSAATSPLLLMPAGRSAILERGVRQAGWSVAIFESPPSHVPSPVDTIKDYALIAGSILVLDSSAWELTEEAGEIIAAYPMQSWRFPLWTGVAQGAVLLGPVGQLFGASRFPSTGYRIDHAGDVIVLMPSIAW